MLETFDRSHWVEEPGLELKLQRIDSQTSPDELRKHYPYCGIVLKTVGTYGYPQGHRLEYVRLLHYPSTFPIEAVVGVQGDELGKAPRRLKFNSMEVQVCEV